MRNLQSYRGKETDEEAQKPLLGIEASLHLNFTESEQLDGVTKRVLTQGKGHWLN